MCSFLKESFDEKLLFLGYITIILVVISDIMSKISMGLNFDFYRYTIIAKSGILFLYTLFFIVNISEYLKSSMSKKIIGVILTLIFLFIISNVYPFNYKEFDFYNIEFLVRYLFYPITFLIFYSLYIHKGNTIKLFRFYEWIFLFNIILVLVAFTCNIELFKSYPNPDRFGFSGIFMRTNQASYIFLIFIAVYYYQKDYEIKGNKIKLTLTILAALLIGTKRLYFFLILLGLFHLYTIRSKIRLKHFMALGVIIVIGYYLKDKLTQIFLTKFNLFVTLYNERGFMASITSYRNEALQETLNNEVINNWAFINILIGGTHFTRFRPQLDVVDLFLFFGIFGIIIYVYWVSLVLKTLYIPSVFLSFFFIVLLLISFTSSGFFNSVNVPFVFMLGAFYLKYNHDLRSNRLI